MMRKVLILGFSLIIFYLVFPQNIQAQGSCTARKNIVSQSCELESNNCQNHYIPWVHEIGAQTISCQCDCIPDPNNPPPTPTPVPSCPGVCRTTDCFDELQEESIGRDGCQNPQAICCVYNPNVTPIQPPPIPPGPGGGCADPNEINTAIGCINVSNPTSFVKSILGLAIGIGGGIAFLLMLFGAFQIMTSGGDPERLKAGKELIGSALAGLLMIIFSVFLLQLIGVQILQIPGLSK